ncbi:hypothetical protein BVY02_01715 [bacterium J17]|nr:hypothetical protein BVY02_01715 [bacterium J17]
MSQSTLPTLLKFAQVFCYFKRLCQGGKKISTASDFCQTLAKKGFPNDSRKQTLICKELGLTVFQITNSPEKQPFPVRLFTENFGP